MSEVCEVPVKSVPEQAVPQVPANHALSCVLPFEVVGKLISQFPATRRPNRNRPIEHPELEAELRAWSDATDEDFESFESQL
jgi:hypothetical protein